MCKIIAIDIDLFFSNYLNTLNTWEVSVNSIITRIFILMPIFHKPDPFNVATTDATKMITETSKL